MNKKQWLFLSPILVILFPILALFGFELLIISLLEWTFVNICEEEYYSFREMWGDFW